MPVYKGKIVNRGMHIWLTKKDRKRKKRYTVTKSQVNKVQFVEIKYMTFKRINGKNRADKLAFGKGLQVENKVYLINGKMKWFNSSKTRITKKYKEVPEWANDYLLKCYHAALNGESIPSKTKKEPNKKKRATKWTPNGMIYADTGESVE